MTNSTDKTDDEEFFESAEWLLRAALRVKKRASDTCSLCSRRKPIDDTEICAPASGNAKANVDALNKLLEKLTDTSIPVEERCENFERVSS